MRIGPKESFQEEAALAGLYLLMNWQFSCSSSGSSRLFWALCASSSWVARYQIRLCFLLLSVALGCCLTMIKCRSVLRLIPRRKNISQLRKLWFRRTADQTGTSLEVLQGCQEVWSSSCSTHKYWPQGTVCSTPSSREALGFGQETQGLCSTAAAISFLVCTDSIF